MNIHLLPVVAFSLTLTLLSLFSPLCQAAEVYKTVDSSGNTLFSDQNGNGAETITITEPQVVIDQSVSNLTKEKKKKIEKDKDKNKKEVPYEITVANPKKDDFFSTQTETIQAAATLNRPLTEGDLMYLYLNGEQFGEGQKNGNFNIQHLDRGQYKLKFTVEQEKASTNKNVKHDRKVLATSEEVPFTQYRAVQR